MIDSNDTFQRPIGSACQAWPEEAQLYLDGELPFERQPALFAHLSSCAACRREFTAVLLFRDLSREERVALPSLVDDELLSRIDRRRGLSTRWGTDRDRLPLWDRRPAVKVRTLVVTLSLFFMLGALFEGGVGRASGLDLHIRQEVEAVQFDARTQPLPHFVIYPGLMVEESR